MNDPGFSVKHEHDLGDHRTADRIEDLTRTARTSAILSSSVLEALASTTLISKESGTVRLLASDKMVYCEAFFLRITLV